MGSEIIEVVERRRCWPAVKLRILDEVLQPGATVSAVADRHGLARNLRYHLLRQVREADAGAIAQAHSGGDVRTGEHRDGGERL